jgi:pimeloyl-ACP methyl ester carboxylesterase
MAEVKRQFIEGTHGQIHFRIADPGPNGNRPLYCLHMSPKSGRSYEALMRIMGRGRTVVAPDYPGYGESTPPPPDPHVCIGDYARSVFDVADALEHRKVDLLGHHTGSQVAAEMAARAPRRIGSIVMISAPVLTAEEQSEFSSLYLPIPLDEEGTRFRVMWERINEHRGPGMTLEMMARSLAENLRGGENYEWGHHAAFSHSARYRTLLTELTHRITVLNPADELQQHSRRAATLLQNGELIEHPEWGHGFLDAFPEDAASAVESALPPAVGDSE